MVYFFLEFYLFGLHENYTPNFASQNRKLYNPGLRFYRLPQKQRLDYEWESILQFGKSQSSSVLTDNLKLNHFAHFHHVEMGYSFATLWFTHLTLAFDYATGDDNPNDANNDRFDSLFGATVFDYGPTGIHRPFIRSNLFGPAIKFEITPNQQLSTYIHFRSFWLASSKDIWAGNSELRDITGNSSPFLGHQFFLSGKWQAISNIFLEGGMVYRMDGDFQKTVPETPRKGNTHYSYFSITLSF